MKNSAPDSQPPAPARPWRPATRATGRVLLDGPGDTLLLFQFRSQQRPGEHSWLTPGGALQDGETPQQAAARELREETGHLVTAARLGPVVAYSTGEWSAGGQRFAGHDSFFWLRTASIEVDVSGQEHYERDLVAGYRWWTATELDVTAERVFPIGLAALMRSLRADGPPAEPVRLPWRA